MPLDSMRFCEERQSMQHSKVCSPLADSSAANGVTAGFSRGMHLVIIRLSCIEILHFSERFARRC